MTVTSQQKLDCSPLELMLATNFALDDVSELLHSLEEVLLDAMFEHEALRVYKPTIQQIDLMIQSIANISGFLEAAGKVFPSDVSVDASSALKTLTLAKIEDRIRGALEQNITISNDCKDVKSVSVF